MNENRFKMSDYYFAAIYVIFFSCVVVSGKQFPSYIKKCSRTGNDLQECLEAAIKDTQPHLLGGIPEFRLPRMDPLILTEVSLQIDGGLDASFRDLQIYNADDFKIKYFNLELERNKMDFNIEFPILRIKSHYQIKGNLLFLQLDGNGAADGNLTNVKVAMTMTGHRIQKKGKEHIQFDNVEIKKMEFGKSAFQFYNLFPNNPELTEQTNVIINRNLKSLVKELQPTIERTIGKTVLPLIGGIFERFSLDELFSR